MSPSRDRDVLIVEDIIDSGRTLAYLIEILRQRNPASPYDLCTLLDKPERRCASDVNGGLYLLSDRRSSLW